MKPITLNMQVRVKLTHFGIECYIKDRVEFRESHRKATGRIPEGFDVCPNLDSDGMISMMLWEAFEKFGKHIHMGGTPPISEIHIDENV